MPRGDRKTPTPEELERASEQLEEDDTHGATTVRHVVITPAFLAQVPKVILSREELNVADLDHRDYFLISHMDGTTTMEIILDICGMPSDEALALLEGLVRRGIVSLGG